MLFEAAFFAGGLHGDRDGAGGGVSVAINVDDDALRRHAEAVCGGGDDALIGLVRDETSEIGASDSVAFEDPFGGLGHFAHGIFVDGLPVLVDVVHFFSDCFGGGRIEASTGGHIEGTGAGTINFVHVVNHADFVLGCGLDEDTARSVAEEDAGGAVGVVNDGGHGVGANDEDFGVRAGFDELGSHLQGVDEAGTGGGEVESPGAFCAELVLDETGGGGEHHIGRNGGDDDGLDFFRADAALGEALSGGFDGHIAGGLSFGDEVAFADTGALNDPLVIGFDHLFEVGVGKDTLRDVSAEGADFGAPRLIRSHGKAQCFSPVMRGKNLFSMKMLSGVYEGDGSRRE